MFYLLRHLRTTLSFPASSIDKVGNIEEVWIHLK
jgi:hypothetical protein